MQKCIDCNMTPCNEANGNNCCYECEFTTCSSKCKRKDKMNMNTSKAKKQGKKEEQEREYCQIRECDVKNVRVVEGKNGDIVFFTLTINGVTIYNCRVATGKNGDFISFPQYKGSNGSYYNNVYVAISDEDSKKILAEVQKAIDEA